MQAWRRLAVIVGSMLTLLIASAGSAPAQQMQNDEFTLQARCAKAARQFFNEIKEKLADNAHFENHYNIRLNKCFVRLYEGPIYDQTSNSFMSIYIYDALEGKQYAEYDGYDICLSGDNHCSMNSGSIWLDANVSRNPPDINEGFPGSNYGTRLGNRNTKAEFISDTDKYFMKY